MRQMYKVESGSFRTTLTNDINNTQTTITVEDTSVLPSAPNYLTIGRDNSKYEVILYTEVSGNDLIGITREVEGIAQSFEAGTPVARYITASDINDIQYNIKYSAEVINFTTENQSQGTNIHCDWINPTSNDFLNIELYVSQNDISNANRDYCDSNATLLASDSSTSYDYNSTVGTTYYFKIFSVYNDLGNTVYSEGVSSIITATDETPPSVISNLSADVDDSQVTLTFDAPADADYAGTRCVYKTGGYPTNKTDGTVIEPYSSGSAITGLTNETEYYFRLFPYDNSGNYNNTESGQQITATPVSFTMDLVYNITDFSAVGATETGGKAELSWTNPADADFQAVLVRRGSSSYPTAIDEGSLVYDGAAESVVDDGLTDDETYYYTVWAYNNANQYSDTSAQIEVTVMQGQDPTGSPGPAVLQAGDEQAGYFGLVPASELFTGLELASELGISQGTSQFDNVDYIKYMYEGKVRFRPLKSFRHSISWDYLYDAGAVYATGSTISAGEQWMIDNDDGRARVAQDAQVSKDGVTYKVGLMNVAEEDPTNSYDDPDRGVRGSEWNAIILPLHANAPSSFAYPEYADDPTPDWRHATPNGTGFTDEDLHTDNSYGDGTYQWGQETRDTSAGSRMFRGYSGASSASNSYSYNMSSNYGWLPRLEVVE